MKKFIVLSIVLLMLAGFAITSSADVVTLFADQDVDVGTLTVVVDGTDLVVTYDIPDDPVLTYPEWELLETHLYVGWTNPEELTSAPGQFPYCVEHDSEDPTFTFIYIIPIADINSYSLKGGKKWVVEDAVPGDVIYIAAQAEVRKQEIDPETGDPIYQEETAWAEGVPIRPDKNWAMYFEFELED